MATKKEQAEARAEELAETIDGVKSDLPMNEIHEIAEHVSCAESCETLEDLRANLTNAIESADDVAKQLRELLKQLDE